MAWTLRPATLGDLPELVGHRDAMWVEMGRIRPGQDDPTSAAYGKWLADRMQAGALHGLVAEEDGKVLASGCVWIQDVQPRPGHPLTMWGYILSVYTVPAARRRGLARAIVTACMERARQAGCTRATLHASAEGRPLYRQLGFEPTDEMWADLRPPEHRPRRASGRPSRTKTGLPEAPIEVSDLDPDAPRRVLYYPGGRWLVVTDAEGRSHLYHDTTAAEFFALVQAESRGAHLDQVVRPGHPRREELPAGHPLLAPRPAARNVVRASGA